MITFIDLDLVKLSDFLIKKNAFIYEAELISEFFPDFKFYDNAHIDTYRVHFILFHHLYKLRPVLQMQGLYLHIHFMRIGVLSYPAEGKCRYFDIQEMRFCEKDAENVFCSIHLSQMPEMIDSSALFYLDKANFDYFDEDVLEHWYSGINLALKNHEYFSKALQIFEIDQSYSIDILKQKYRTLAKKHHPDLNIENIYNYQEFLEINRAYQFLLRCKK